MPLYEFRCQSCQNRFEQITREGDSDYGTCPKCAAKSAKRLISLFVVAGQGDLRTSTIHGCHGCYTGHHHHHGPASADETGDKGDAKSTDGSEPTSGSSSTPPAAATGTDPH